VALLTKERLAAAVPDGDGGRKRDSSEHEFSTRACTRGDRDREPGACQTEAGHRSRPCMCAMAHSGGMVVHVDSPAGPVETPMSCFPNCRPGAECHWDESLAMCCA
jgi:hypothetical protein